MLEGLRNKTRGLRTGAVHALEGTYRVAGAAKQQVGSLAHQGLRLLTKTTVPEGPLDPLTAVAVGARQAIANAVSPIEHVARAWRALDRIHPDDCPVLLEDPVDNQRLIRTISEYLDGDAATKLPFDKEIDHVASLCFQDDVHPTRVMDFLESDLILARIVEEVLHHIFDNTRYRGTSLISTADTIPRSAAIKVKNFVTRFLRDPVEGSAIEADLERFFEDFIKIYNPADGRVSLSTCVDVMKTDFQCAEIDGEQVEYDIFGWLLKKKPALVAMLKNHVVELVKNTYYEQGKKHPKKFIDIFKSDFLTIANDEVGPVVSLNETALYRFARGVLPEIATPRMNLRDLSEMVISECTRAVPDDTQNYNVVERRDDNYDSFTMTPKEILTRRIRSQAEQKLDHIAVRDLMAAPHQIPLEIREVFNQLFPLQEEYLDETADVTAYIDSLYEGSDKNAFALRKTVSVEEVRGGAVILRYRKFDQKAYNSYLKKLFGRPPSNGDPTATPGTPERLRVTKKRVSQLIKQVHEALQYVSEFLGEDAEMSSAIREINNLAELYFLAGSNRVNELERIEARRVIELLIVQYQCEMIPRRVFAKYDEECIFEWLQENGMEITNNVARLHFTEYAPSENMPEGRVVLLHGPERAASFQGSIPGHFDCLVGTIGDTPCGFLLSKDFSEAHAEAPNTVAEDEIMSGFINNKSWLQFLLKRIRKEETEAEDITDISRSTGVATNREDFDAITDYMNNNLAISGLRFEYEDLYDEFTAKNNPASNKGYKHRKWILYVPAVDKANKRHYFARYEFRLMEASVIAQERSQHHPISHNFYEFVRAADMITKLVPADVQEYEERFYEEDQNVAARRLGVSRKKLKQKPTPSSSASSQLQ